MYIYIYMTFWYQFTMPIFFMTVMWRFAIPLPWYITPRAYIAGCIIIYLRLTNANCLDISFVSIIEVVPVVMFNCNEPNAFFSKEIKDDLAWTKPCGINVWAFYKQTSDQLHPSFHVEFNYSPMPQLPRCIICIIDEDRDLMCDDIS